MAVVGNLFQRYFCNPNLTVHTSKQQNWMNWRAAIFLNQTTGNSNQNLFGQIFMSKNCGRNTTLFPQLHRYSAFFRITNKMYQVTAFNSDKEHMIHVPFLGPRANVRKYVVSGWDVFHGECFPDTTCCFKMNQTIVKPYHFVCDIKFARRWIDSEPKHNFQMYFFIISVM